MDSKASAHTPSAATGTGCGPLIALVLSVAAAAPAQVLIEAESFADRGGWKLDTQFIDVMGSPFLLAHGLGRPVKDAETVVDLPAAGRWHVWVRTYDWVARWNAPGQPGRFKLIVDGQALAPTFGTTGATWGWQKGGSVEVASRKVKLALRDLTGFDGRCDAIVLSQDAGYDPPVDSAVLPAWRRKLLGLPDEPRAVGPYDLVVVGGGYSGMGTAISAARMGCKVALIQNRDVLGGNGSSEVRVWAKGLIRRGRFPRIGEIIEEFADSATRSPGRAQEFGDAKKEAVVRAEPNIDLFLGHHVYAVESSGNTISSVVALETRTSKRARFRGRLFSDCTGHGTVGFLAGADFDMTPVGRMGMSNMWRWAEGDAPVSFPETPWALDLEMEDFPYPRDHHGEWFWESGYDKHPITQAEAIRDHNLRAVFGAFNAMKNRGGKAKHERAYLEWVAFIGGPRESRRLMGDVVLTQDDVVKKRAFPDGCVPSTWSIDLHYPKKRYAKKFPDNPFIAIAEHDRRVDRAYGYPVPYRCFYSRNIKNLFMAGRCISVTHEALGTVRVMKTCGMMGEVVGKAASICIKHGCLPRDVHEEHLQELLGLLELPGKARRPTVTAAIDIPEDVPTRGIDTITGVDPATLPGTVQDDRAAERVGHWTEGQGLKGYVAHGYVYAHTDSGARIVFRLQPRAPGSFEVRIAYRHHENRGARVPVSLVAGRQKKSVVLDMRKKPDLAGGFLSLGRVTVKAKDRIVVTVGTDGAGGYVCADAVQLLPVR